MPTEPFHPYNQSFGNCSGRWQSQQHCDCSGGVSAAAGAVGAVFIYTEYRGMFSMTSDLCSTDSGGFQCISAQYRY